MNNLPASQAAQEAVDIVHLASLRGQVPYFFIYIHLFLVVINDGIIPQMVIKW